MDINKYLTRLNLNRSEGLVGINGLRTLHHAHYHNIPFENIDIYFDQEIPFSLEYFFKKIVGNDRGGFCFEHNSLMHWALKELGYTVDYLSARVWDEKKKCFGPEFDHMALRVNLNGENYLVDVGYGDHMAYPILLEPNSVQQSGNNQFRVSPTETGFLLERLASDNRWHSVYLLNPDPQKKESFNKMFNWHQTAAESKFKQKLIVTLPTWEGRVSLSLNRLLITEAGHKKILRIAEQSDFYKFLQNYFGIVDVKQLSTAY